MYKIRHKQTGLFYAGPADKRYLWIPRSSSKSGKVYRNKDMAIADALRLQTVLPRVDRDQLEIVTFEIREIATEAVTVLL